MPTYRVTDDVTGITLDLTGESAPTGQELEDLFSQYAQPEKLTEETIVKDANWIQASRNVYAMNEGPDAPELQSDEEAANYGLRYMGWFNYNLPKMGLEAAQLGDATDEQKESFVKLMDMYDEKAPSLAGAYRAVKGLAFDPSTYLGIGTFGAATAGTQALKQGIKEGVKQATKAGLTQGAKIGAIEGGVYSAADQLGRETARVQADAQDSIDLGNIAQSAAIGAGAGSVLGGSIGAIAGRKTGKQYQEALESQTKALETQTTDVALDVVPYDEDAAQSVRANLADAPEGFNLEPVLDVTEKGVRVAEDFMNRMEIPVAPDQKVSDQIFEILQLTSTSDEYMKAFSDVLKQNKINEVELAQLFRLGASDAGRTLQKLSAAKKGLRSISEEISGKAPKDMMGASLLRKFHKGATELDNVRRGLLVSQVATFARNFTAQYGRVGMHTLVNAVDNSLNQAFNPVRKLFGQEQRLVDHNKTFNLLMNISRDKKFAKDVTELVDYLPAQKDRLFSNYVSDVKDASKNTTFKLAGKLTDGLNTLNRMQEYYFRRAMFSASLENTLSKRGVDLKKLMQEDGRAIEKISTADIEKAVDDALEFTYAKTPEGKLGKAFIDFSNSIPFVTTAVFPFARFMANAMEFQFKHSPLGPLSLLSKKEQQRVAAGDSQVLAKTMVGSAALLAAIEAKRDSVGDKKWYEIETETGKTVDMRPYFPLTPYMLVADLAVRAERGLGGIDSKDIIQGLTGAQFRAGTGLSLVDSLINDVSGVDSEERIRNVVTRWTSDVLGGFLTPLRMFNDFIDQKQEFRQYVPRSDQEGYFSLEDILGNLQRSVPILQRELPKVESPTRAAAPRRPETLQIPFTDKEISPIEISDGLSILGAPTVRQLTGVTVREAKNAAEREFDRLGYKMRDIRPYTGDRKADRMIDKYMGPIVENIIAPLVETKFYKDKSNAQKDAYLRKALQEVRSVAKTAAIKDDPQSFLRVYVKRRPKYERRILQENNPEFYKELTR
jgi:hypothetical protein